jgi:lipoprotein NlpI
MGNNPAALADFTRSIQLNPGDPAAYFNRGVAYFVVGGRIADAEADFRTATELRPTDAYAALWLDLAARRNHAPSRLPEAAKQLDMIAWPAPITRRFLGELNTAQTLAAANDGDSQTKLGQSCEANFYSGEFELLQKNRQQAASLLRLAANNCPRGFIESAAAIAELIAQH